MGKPRVTKQKQGYRHHEPGYLMPSSLVRKKVQPITQLLGATAGVILAFTLLNIFVVRKFDKPPVFSKRSAKATLGQSKIPEPSELAPTDFNAENPMVTAEELAQARKWAKETAAASKRPVPVGMVPNLNLQLFNALPTSEKQEFLNSLPQKVRTSYLNTMPASQQSALLDALEKKPSTTSSLPTARVSLGPTGGVETIREQARPTAKYLDRLEKIESQRGTASSESLLSELNSIIPPVNCRKLHQAYIELVRSAPASPPPSTTTDTPSTTTDTTTALDRPQLNRVDFVLRDLQSTVPGLPDTARSFRIGR
ncbi:hypothetical protein [Armatimonas rosea]|uniref:Uncharacterized protein n=1 Tax=Armatimonas rosea TaxID=685828 RepID=A0A7W9W5T8_ARMRO|nr:hypothetical protein [Armatimonas rosea]MBB6048917.1 hypothetical protein [Armatimonas rosea]